MNKFQLSQMDSSWCFFKRCFFLFFLFLIPIKILSTGYLPYDDALRHSAKVFSQKEWTDILIMREGMWLDSHPGWHSFLAGVKNLFSIEQVDVLVCISILSLFCLVTIPPLFFWKRVEAWLAAWLLLLVIEPTWMIRLINGRPLLFSVFVLLWVFLREKAFSKEDFFKKDFWLYLVLFSLATWIHCQWYLFLMIPFAFLLARQFRGALNSLLTMGLGVFAGAALSGHPLQLLKQSFLHVVISILEPKSQIFLVPEFQARPIKPILMILFFLCMVLSVAPKRLLKSPSFYLSLLCLFLGQLVSRFWVDWGLPVFWITLAREIDLWWEEHLKSYRVPLALTVILGLALFFLCSGDFNQRYSGSSQVGFLHQKDPIPDEWKPGDKGVVYSDLTSGFMWTFYKYPEQNWRYVLAFESALMKKEDLDILRHIQLNPFDGQRFDPWVKKMKPADRLMLMNYPESPPSIKGFKWWRGPSEVWIGKWDNNKDK